MTQAEYPATQSPTDERADAFELATRTVQFLAVDAVERANSGHPGAPMGLAAIGVDLFSRYLRYDPAEPTWPNRDRFVLSCGHASMLVYALLHLAGYDLSLDDLKQFRQWGSRTPGHPEVAETPGVEATTGPLGQGVGNAVGLALAGKLAAARVNAPGVELINYRVLVLASDGDLMEGVSAEAASLAGHLALDNLIVIYDDNRITIDGGTELTFSEDVPARFEAYGWSVARVDGHNPAEVRAALDRALEQRDRPSLIAARTHIGMGAPSKQDTSSCHGSPLGAAETEAAKRAAGWPLEPFYVPAGVRELFQAHVERNRREHERWRQLRDRASTEQAELYDQLSSRTVPADLLERLLAGLQTQSEATRAAAGKVQQVAARLVPSLVQGAADLAASTKTRIVAAGDIGPGQFEGRNLHYGVREHGMGAVMNGLALSGWFIPVGSTFLVFADYMRPSIRMAALMRQQAIYVFTHDSIFVGEDGPTHQPIEQLWSLRMIPNLDVFRPADALECAAAWSYALGRRTGPTALSLSRQKLPPLERGPKFKPSDVLRGAYVLCDSPEPELVLIATGSEVHVTLQAQRLLLEQGRRARVVSAPCWQAFERLPPAEQEAVVGSRLRRVTVEAGMTRGWTGVAGDTGLAIGIDHFGASAPAPELAERFGFTAQRIAEQILAKL